MNIPNYSLFLSIFFLLSLGFCFGAIIEYSALVNRIKGRVSHSVLSFWKGISIIKRHNSGVHQPRTEKQQQIRGNFSTIAGEFYSLTLKYRELWGAHASMLPTPMTALNAFLKYNMLLEKYLPGTTRMTGPPKTPATPGHIVGFTVSALAASDFCIEFTKPVESTIYAIVDYWAMPGRDAVTSPRWTFGASAGADTGDVLVALAYPTDTVVRFRARTMDSSGRVSPWSHTLSLPAL